MNAEQDLLRDHLTKIQQLTTVHDDRIVRIVDEQKKMGIKQQQLRSDIRNYEKLSTDMLN